MLTLINTNNCASHSPMPSVLPDASPAFIHNRYVPFDRWRCTFIHNRYVPFDRWRCTYTTRRAPARSAGASRVTSRGGWSGGGGVFFFFFFFVFFYSVFFFFLLLFIF